MIRKYTLLILIGWFAMALCVAQPTQAASQGPSAERLLEEANEYFNEEDYAKAIHRYQQFLAQYPEHEAAAQAQYYLGMSHMLTGAYPPAIESFVIVTDKYADSEWADDALFHLRDIHESHGRRDQAIESARELYTKHTDSPRTALIIDYLLEANNSSCANAVYAGEEHLLEDDQSAARTEFERALTCYEHAENTLGQVYALELVAVTRYNEENFTEAITMYEQALTLSEEIDSPDVAKADLYTSLATIHHNQENFLEAAEAYEAALSIWRETDNVDARLNTLFNLGRVYSDWDRLQTAVTYYDQALDIAREQKDPYSEGIALQNLANIQVALKQYDVASQNYQLLLALTQELGARSWEGATNDRLGDVSRLSGDGPAALTYYERARRISINLGDRYTQASALTGIALVYATQGQFEESVKRYEEATPLLVELDNPNLADSAMTVLEELKEIFQESDPDSRALDTITTNLIPELDPIARRVVVDPATALFNEAEDALDDEEYQTALELFQEFLNDYGDDSLAGEATVGVILSYIGLERPDEAKRLAETLLDDPDYAGVARVILDRIEAEDNLSPIDYQCLPTSDDAATTEEAVSGQEAIQRLQTSLECYRKNGDRVGEAWMIYTMGEVYEADSEFTLALENYENVLALDLDQAVEEQLAVIVNAQEGVARIYVVQGNTEDALARREANLQLVLDNGATVVDQVEVRHRIADTYVAMDNPAQAIETHEETLALIEGWTGDELEPELQGFFETEKKRLEGVTKNFIGLTLQQQEAYDEALAMHNEAATLLRGADAIEDAVAAYNNAGDALYFLKRYTEAHIQYNEASSLARAIEFTPGEIQAHRNLGDLRRVQGLYREALESYETALEIQEEFDVSLIKEILLMAIADMHTELGAYEAAQAQYQEALILSRQTGSSTDEVNALMGIGLLRMAQGEYGKARYNFLTILDILSENEEAGSRWVVLLNIADSYSSQGRYQEALRYYDQALALTEDDEAGKFVVYVRKGRTYNDQGEYQMALDTFEAAKEFVSALEDPLVEAELWNGIGLVYTNQGQYDEAIAAHDQALQIMKKEENLAGEGLVLTLIGDTHLERGFSKEAIHSYNTQVLTISRQLASKSGEQLGLTKLGDSYLYEEQYNPALENYEDALEIALNSHDRGGEWWIRTRLGTLKLETGPYSEAELEIQEALNIASEIESQVAQIEGTRLLGQVQENIGRYQDASAIYEQALTQAEDINALQQQADTQLSIAGVHLRQGRYESAMDAVQIAFEIHQDNDNQAGMATTYMLMARVFAGQGQFDEALSHHQQALQIWQEIEDYTGEAAVYNGMAAIYLRQDRFDQATQYTQKAQDVYDTHRDEASGTLPGELSIRITRAEIAEAHGDYETAAAIYANVAIARGGEVITQSVGVAQAQMSQGDAQAAMYRFEAALATYQSALSITQHVGALESQAMLHGRIARVYLEQDNYKAARDHLDQGIEVATEIENNELVAALTLVRLDTVGSLTTDSQAVCGSLDNHIEQCCPEGIRYAGNDSLQAQYCEYIKLERQAQENDQPFVQAFVYFFMGRFHQCLAIDHASSTSMDSFHQCPAIAQVNNNNSSFVEPELDHALAMYRLALTKTLEADAFFQQGAILNRMAEVHLMMGDTDAALEAVEKADKIIHETGSLTPTALLQTLGDVHRTRGDVHRARGDAHLAETEYKQANAIYNEAIENLEDVRTTISSDLTRTSFIADYASLFANNVDVLEKLGNDEAAFEMSERGRARTFLDQLTGGVRLSDASSVDLQVQIFASQNRIHDISDQLRFEQLQTPPDEEAIAALKKELARAQEKLAQLQNEANNEAEGIEKRLETLGGSTFDLPDIQQKIPPHTTLISYFVVETRTLAFVLTEDSFNVIEVPLSQYQAKERTNVLRGIIEDGDDTEDEAQKLYTRLIAPVAPYLDDTTRLLIVPHGLLHYLPFGALQNPETGSYLMEEYELVMLPSASTLALPQQVSANEPQNLDSGTALVLGISSTFPEDSGLLPLSNADDEARTVAEMFGSDPILELEATEKLLREQFDQANILHIASHGVYSESNPLAAKIVLVGDDKHDGALTVPEIYEELEADSLELVVLSACETQIGDLSNGDDITGLTRGFMVSGTPSIVSSLWNVDDEATSIFMQSFYGHLRGGRSKAQALRLAQLDLIAADETYRHPYYWSAFVLSGDGGPGTSSLWLVTIGLVLALATIGGVLFWHHRTYIAAVYTAQNLRN